MATFLGDLQIPASADCPSQAKNFFDTAVASKRTPGGTSPVLANYRSLRQAALSGFETCNFEDLCAAVPNNANSKALYLLTASGFLDPQHAMQCSKCPQFLQARLANSVSSDAKYGLWWKCPSSTCKNHNSILLDTFIPSSTKISLSLLLRILYAFTHDWPVVKTVTEVRLSKPTVVSWFSNLRALCSSALSAVKIGGDGLIVEVRELEYS